MNLLPKPGGCFSCFVLLKQGLQQGRLTGLELNANQKPAFNSDPPGSNLERIMGGLRQGHVIQTGFELLFFFFPPPFGKCWDF